MASQENRMKVEPDLEFIRDVLDNGGDSLKKCFQCGACSVVCNLAPDKSPFPRQEMIWAQWGLKDKLVNDPNVWTCFQCIDCSAHCPRGANPGDVLGAIRKKVIEGLAFPAFLGKAVGDPQYWVGLALFPGLLMLAILFMDGTADLREAPIEYGKMISHIQMNIVFPFFSALAGLAFLVGINRLWTGASGKSLIEFLPSMDKGRMVRSIIDVIKDILAHKDFEKCDANKSRKIAHLLVFYAFLGLLATTVLAIVVLLAAIYMDSALGEYPMNWYHPVKWLGNASAIALIAGSGLMIQNRRQMAQTGDMKSSDYDLFFLYIVFGVGVTGTLAQFFRFFGLPPLIAYSTYWLHLVLVFSFLIYSPYSKFAHFIYRTIALVHNRYDELGQQEPVQQKSAEADEARAA